MAQDDGRQESQVGLKPGTRVGKYEVVERIAIGGQAIVYKCHDQVLDRFVALKQISSHLAEDPRFLERFRNEAQILAKLSARQPAIVTIHDILEDQQGLFIVMEYVQGQTIEEILQITKGPIESKPVLRILWRLAGAMHDVHEAGYIHRDLKPQNLLIQEGIKPKITDFGVAASRSGQTSMVLGTTKYMAPELFGSEEVDGRCDIYSLGMVAYEMLLGRPKFREIFSDMVRDPHSEALRWMKWHGNRDAVAPRLDEVNPQVPNRLADIVEKMLAKDPQERFASMEELGRAIKLGFAPKRQAAGGGKDASVDLEDTDLSPALPAEEAEPEADQGPAAPPPTAPLKRSGLSKRTKITLGVLAGVLLIGAIGGLFVYRARQRQDRSSRAASLFDEGMKLYKDSDYAQATRTFSRAARDYPQTVGGQKANVMSSMARAWVALTEGDWGQAGNYQQEARKAVADVNRSASEGSDLHRWARETEEDIRQFRQKQLTIRSFREAVNGARTALDKKDFQGAREALAGVDQEGWSPEQRKIHFDLSRRVQREALEHQLEQTLNQIDALRTQARQGASLQRYDEALQALDEASGLLVGLRDLLDQDRRRENLLSEAGMQGYADRADRIEPQLVTQRRFAQSMQKALAARQQDDAAAELTHLQAALKIREDPEVSRRVEELTLLALRRRALDLAANSRTDEAVEALREYLKKRPDDPAARQALDDLLAGEKWQAMMLAGREAFDKKDYAAALEHYRNAQAIRRSDELTARLNQTQYQIHWSQAWQQVSEGDYEKAEAALAACRQYAPENAARIDVVAGIVDRLQSYELHMAAGAAASSRGEYAQARQAFGQAQEQAQAIVSDARLDDDTKKKLCAPAEKLAQAKSSRSEAFYLEQMTQGKRRFSEGRFKEAAALFNLALEEAQTQKQRGEAKDWASRAKESIEGDE